MKSSFLFCVLCAAAFPLTAAEPDAAALERITPSPFRLSVKSYPEAKPQSRRSIASRVECANPAPRQFTLTALWIGAAEGGGARTLLKIEPRIYTAPPHSQIHAVLESGEQTSPIEGWMVTVRDTGTSALLAVKASSHALETLARTSGAIPNEPGPLPVK